MWRVWGRRRRGGNRCSIAAVQRVEASRLGELVITDSIAAYESAAGSDKVRILTIAPLLAEAIKRIADESSVSSLFD